MKNVYTRFQAAFFILLLALSLPLSTHAQNWQTSTTGLNINKVWMLNTTTGWAVGSNGLILYTSNGGSTWASQTSGTTRDLTGIWGSDANNIWVVGSSGTILKYDGSTWASQTSGTTQFLNGVWGSDANNIWAVGNAGTILKSNGSTWASQTSGTTQNILGVWGSDANNIWAVGQSGTILKYNGSTWASQTSGTTQILLGVWGSDANNIWAVGFNGTILKYNGSTWGAEVAGFSTTNRAIIGVGTRGFITGNSGTVFTKTLSVAMPVELLSFLGKNTESGNRLTWQTANEMNNKGFQIERLNGNDWQNIGFKTANNKASNYQFMDNTPLSISSYRLRQIDNDGKETLSKTITIQSKGTKGKLAVYPNPVSNVLMIETSASNLDYQVINLLGQTILRGTAQTQIDVSALPKGSYVLKVGIEQVKFMKQ